MPYRAPVHKPHGATSKPKPRPKDQRPSRSKRGYGRAWQKLRAWILSGDPLCRMCEARGLVVAATDVDHIIAREKGGTDEEANLQPLCKSCHSSKTAREDGGFGHQPRGQG